MNLMKSFANKATIICFIFALFSFFICPKSAFAIQTISVDKAYLNVADKGYSLHSSFLLYLEDDITDALLHGLDLDLIIDINVGKPNSFWFDKNVFETKKKICLTYNAITSQYLVKITGNENRYFSSLENAMNYVRHPPTWLLFEKGFLQVGTTYEIAVKISLDTKLLPKRLRSKLNEDNHLRISSDWKKFEYTPIK